MRILYITNNFTPYSGGVVSSIKTTSQALAKVGHEVRIITLDFLGSKHQDPAHIIRLFCPIKFTYKTNHMAVPWRPAARIQDFCRNWRPDIIHVHHPFLLGQSALYVAQQMHIPIVFTYHTLYETYAHYVPFFTGITQIITKKIVQKFCNRVDGIIIPTRPVGENLQQIRTPLTIIPSPLDELFFQKKLGIKKRNNPFQLLVVSRFVQEKNLTFLLDMMTQLSQQFSLTLVGYGPEYESLQQYAYEDLKLPTNRVRFVYKPAKEQLIDFYQAADLFIFSSTTDTQGLVLAEAMSQGTPVVTLHGPGQQDIIRNEYNGFIVDCAEEMIEKIVKISQDYDLHQQLQQGAWQTAQHYQSKFIVEKIVNFYEKILDNPVVY